MSSNGELQRRRAPKCVQNFELYLTMGGLGGQKQQTTPENHEKLYFPLFLLLYFSAPLKPFKALY